MLTRTSCSSETMCGSQWRDWKINWFLLLLALSKVLRAHFSFSSFQCPVADSHSNGWKGSQRCPSLFLSIVVDNFHLQNSYFWSPEGGHSQTGESSKTQNTSCKKGQVPCSWIWFGGEGMWLLLLAPVSAVSPWRWSDHTLGAAQAARATLWIPGLFNLDVVLWSSSITPPARLRSRI